MIVWGIILEYEFQRSSFFVQPPDPIQTRQMTSEGLFSGAFHGHAQNCPRHDKHKDMTNINSWLKIISQFQFGISESEITNIFQVGASSARFVATIF